MSEIDGGENETGFVAEENLAPVIPLFGQRERAGSPAPRPSGDGVWHASWIDEERRDSRARASGSPRSTPLRPADAVAPFPGRPEARGRSGGAGGGSRVSFVPDDDASEGSAAVVADPDDVRAEAESTLLRRLRTRQLSVSEAHGVVVDAGLSGHAADELIEQFERLGYLDDASLAEQLMHAAVTRKRQGRQAIGPLLTKRGIPRDVADAAIAALPDDDLERALEFARTKARSLGARDRETALRRLLGQLARRGYPSSVSMTAARQALDEL